MTSCRLVKSKNNKKLLESALEKCEISLDLEAIDWDLDLFKGTYLDSFDILNIVFEIERITGQTIKPEKLEGQISLNVLLGLIDQVT